ncbi:MAG: N-acyl homoserine lactonase family protein [Hamadaea sp.]|nr:N-acyl homoserine lactonase family protein [Hamadaea sp.]NUT02551.1 N-acyl homoserine lactonase family protein [Hamadaea sp.]
MLRRLDLGHIIRPASEAGTEHPRVESILAYVVRRPEGVLLFDTGIGSHPEVDDHYRPHRRDLRTALADAGVRLDEVSLVVNCHLHFDHCGGNPLFPGTPILAQRTELSTARTTEYTLPELVDFTGARYDELDGETELWPGMWIIPTPGHTDGHQSLVVRRDDGTVVLAGQAHDFASEFSHDHLAYAVGAAPHSPWLERLLQFDPRRVLFAHDSAVWEPPR